jgi:hypothetical protein
MSATDSELRADVATLKRHFESALLEMAGPSNGFKKGILEISPRGLTRFLVLTHPKHHDRITVEYEGNVWELTQTSTRPQAPRTVQLQLRSVPERNAARLTQCVIDHYTACS